MGLICPCGVKVNANSLCKNVIFNDIEGTVAGNLTYSADISITKLKSSTLSLKFEDIESPDTFNFLFKANAITCISCEKEDDDSVITVKGTGMIGMREYSFEAIFRDQGSQAENDIIQFFSIYGFFDQYGEVPVAQGSVVFLGPKTL